MNQPPPLPPARRKSEWYAILTSLAYPGAGQFFQGRRLVAIALTGMTTLVALWWIAMLCLGVWQNAQEMLGGEPTRLLGGLRYLGPPTRGLGICYLVSFVDVVVAHVWMRRAAARQK